MRKTRWLMPLIIVIAAAAMSWWSAKTASAVERHVRNEVIELIPLVQNNPEIVDNMVIDPVLCAPVSKALTEVSMGWSGDKNDLFVTVTTGDDPVFGDGTATHVAIVGVGERSAVGLRILCKDKNSPMIIAGIWTP
jgi:hypothetical protein